ASAAAINNGAFRIGRHSVPDEPPGPTSTVYTPSGTGHGFGSPFDIKFSINRTPWSRAACLKWVSDS
ncbi:hypothetical protein E4U37_005483, partial [Claviceps purpurea]